MGRLLRFRRIKHALPDEPLRLDIGLRRSWLDSLSTSQFTLLVLFGCGAMACGVFTATDLQARRHAMTYVGEWWSQIPRRETNTTKITSSRSKTGNDWAEEPQRIERQQVSALQCHPSYGGCLPTTGDVDCIGGKGNGPFFTGRVLVKGHDVYGLDSDGDGIGCE